jgi:PiT family inorganic phosphate transporter
MGLIMLIMIGVVPASFALNLAANPGAITKIQTQSALVAPLMQAPASSVNLDLPSAKIELQNYLKQSGKARDRTFAALAAETAAIGNELKGLNTLSSLPDAERSVVRTQAYLVSSAITKLDKGKKLTVKSEDTAATKYAKSLNKITLFIPIWVKFAVAIALGLGTMIGWKRIVVTLGEKIGKEHLTYAQGASAELVAMITIMLASAYKLPVSTTHVLSSGIAGTMAANKSGLQMDTLRNIAMAWLLTLPVCVILGAGIFAASLQFVFHVLHFH